MKVTSLKTTLSYCLLGSLLATAGCNTTKVENQTTTQAVAPTPPTGNTCETAKTVRSVTDAKGFVSYDKATGQYRITSAVPGTVDEVTVGYVCGELPADLRTDNRKVVFSGTYKEYVKAPAAPAGYTAYFLSIQKISAE